MRGLPRAWARARAKSVFPTPAGPSTSTGFSRRSARNAAVAISVDARYPVASRRPSASVTEVNPPDTPVEEGGGVTECSTVKCRPCFVPAARPMRISWISEVRQPGTNAGPARAKQGRGRSPAEAPRGANVRSRGLKTGVGVVALLLPGGLLFLIGWVLVRALARASVRLREEMRAAGETGGVWQAVSTLSFRDVLREARATL